MTPKSNGLSDDAAAIALVLAEMLAEMDRSGGLCRRISTRLWRCLEDETDMSIAMRETLAGIVSALRDGEGRDGVGG